MGEGVVANPDEKRRSARIFPIGGNEDVVILNIGDTQRLAKILDISDGGVCVELVEPGATIELDDSFRMSLYHNQQITDIEVKVCRKTGAEIGLEFKGLSDQAEEQVRAKAIRLAVEWVRKKPTP